MSAIGKFIGYAYLLAWVMSACGYLDMVVCVGKPGACAATPARVR